jgi:acyl carrier protein
MSTIGKFALPACAKLDMIDPPWVEWRAQMRERVIETLQKILGPEVDLDDTRLELASLRMLEVVVALENEFGAHIPEDAPLARITSSVDNIVAYLSKLR